MGRRYAGVYARATYRGDKRADENQLGNDVVPLLEASRGRRWERRYNETSAAGFRRGDDDGLVPHEAVWEMIALWAQGKPLRGIAEAVHSKGHQMSHEGVAGVLRAAACSGVQE